MDGDLSKVRHSKEIMERETATFHFFKPLTIGREDTMTRNVKTAQI